MVKAMALSAVGTGTVAFVLGTQGTHAGPLAVHALEVADYRMYWSWPLFSCGALLTWGLMWLQR